MSNENSEYTFSWFIENYSYCWHKKREKLVSPEFTSDGLEGTIWTLLLYPRGSNDEYEDSISLYLNRNKADDGPRNYPLAFELALLLTDGSIIRSGKIEVTFESGYGYGMPSLVKLNDVFSSRKADYLPQDTLNVCCNIWKGDGNILQAKHITARTRIGIEQISFLHVIEDFSALKPNQKKKFQIKSPSKKEPALSSSMYFLNDSWCEGKIVVEIIPSDIIKILSRCKLSLLNETGKRIEFAKTDNRFDTEGRCIQKIPLNLTRSAILNQKNEYLLDDKLSLLCECIFSTGVEFEKIEKVLHEMPFVAISQINDYDQNKDMYNATEKLSLCPNALDDFKEIYNDQLLIDVDLKTKTKTFSTHRLVLCARSSVFRAMLTNDMKEKNTNSIKVDDLEDDTVQQLLLFLYSDNLENLQWESAIKLYYAADKYAIEKLKVLCSSFLVNNMNLSTASELLLLADTHNDSDLKKAVEDFIFKHEEQIFGSDEWGNLMLSNPLLVSKTMRLKYIRKV